MEAIEQIYFHHNSLSVFTMPGHMRTPPPPPHPESPGVLVTCPLLSFPPQSSPAEKKLDVILSSVQRPPSLLHRSEARFHPAVEAGRSPSRTPVSRDATLWDGRGPASCNRETRD